MGVVVVELRRVAIREVRSEQFYALPDDGDIRKPLVPRYRRSEQEQCLYRRIDEALGIRKRRRLQGTVQQEE